MVTHPGHDDRPAGEPALRVVRGDATPEEIAAHPDIAARVREGRVAAVGPLVGEVMTATGGQADAARVRQLILDRLS
jgi:aspartyl-tRNA(Asn)/glutamyl-tRNA(Gln) amidotransferase subunit B